MPKTNILEYKAQLTKELDLKMVVGKSTRTIEKYIVKLIADGAIKRTGPKVGGDWQVNDSNA